MNPQIKFWNWFVKHQKELLCAEGAQDQLLDQIANKIQEYDSDLTFELGPKGLQRELVISAGGIKQAFPSLIALVNAAPVLESWQITAFRPRRMSPNVIEFQGKIIDSNDVWFSLLDDGKNAGIYLFIPGFQEGDVILKQIGYLILDDMLGEYDVETRLGLIKMLSPEVQTVGDRYPLVELPGLFDQLTSRLERRSGKAS